MKDITIIGGDLRIVYLAKMLAEGNRVYTYALEKAEELYENSKIQMCLSLDESICKSEIIIAPVPISIDNEFINAKYSIQKIRLAEFLNKLNNKKVFAGKLDKKLLNDKNQYIDLLEKEELSVLNSIATAEGAIQVAMEETKITLHGSNILIMGFGRIGKILSKMLLGIGANIYCEARKKTDLAWIKAYGYIPIDLNEIDKYLGRFDIIFNNIPKLVLNEERLKRINENCVIIDLASKPGGVDYEKAKEKNIKTILALGLPRKGCTTYISKIFKRNNKW